MTDDLLKNTLEIQHAGERYVFRIPSFEDEIKIGMLERKLRAAYDPDGNGDPTGLEYQTYLMVKTIARLQTLLKQSSAKWIYTEKPGGVVEIDPSTWPSNRVDDVLQMGVAFEKELLRFRTGGAAAGDDAGAQAVDGQPHSG